jgi:topoisomerase-4 subunit A
MLIFPAKDLPEMGRGAGVKLQRYKDGGLSDAKVFTLETGLNWTDGSNRQHSLSKSELRDWRGNRADAGRLAPKGVPKTNRFRP